MWYVNNTKALHYRLTGVVIAKKTKRNHRSQPALHNKVFLTVALYHYVLLYLITFHLFVSCLNTVSLSQGHEFLFQLLGYQTGGQYWSTEPHKPWWIPVFSHTYSAPAPNNVIEDSKCVLFIPSFLEHCSSSFRICVMCIWPLILRNWKYYYY